MNEPTVLDYVKAKLRFWQPSELHFPSPETAQPLEMTAEAVVGLPHALEAPAAPSALASAAEAAVVEPVHFPWRISLALVLALGSQIALEPPLRSAGAGAAGYLASAALLAWGVLKRDWQAAPLKADERLHTSTRVRLDLLLMSIPLAAITFLSFGGGRFTFFNTLAWLVTSIVCIRAFWVSQAPSTSFAARLKDLLGRPAWRFTLTRQAMLRVVLIAGVVAAVLFFRLYQLKDVPGEMVSDHAEKLLDVGDVLNGQLNVFFPRNTGREFFQFYLTAAIVRLFDQPLSFLTLKLGTTLCGLLTLPFIYLLGKELANRRVGLLAALLAGIAYWPNLFTRIGLRFTLYPFFAAPALYFLMRGLRRQNRNDFIWAGLFLGLGLHGYTSFRIMPFVVLAAVGLYLLHPQSRGARWQTFVGLGALVAVSFVVFLPLFRYAVDNPEMFAYRAFTRLGTWERPLPGPALQILLSNLWNALTMFFWSDGNTWVHSVVYRPALDVVSAGLFFLGLGLVAARYLRTRNWSDPFLLVSIPLLMMPSILSLAFPGENPSLNRTAGAIIPVFIVAAVGLDALLTGLKEKLPGRFGTGLAGAVLVLLLVWSGTQNYRLVFIQYADQYRQNTWNYTEVGQIIHSFATSVGTYDSAWVVAYPYWYDTRLVGIEAGVPGKDFAIWPKDLATTLSETHTKLFIVNKEDSEGIATLRQLYPQASEWTHHSLQPGKDFIMYLVPPKS